MDFKRGGEVGKYIEKARDIYVKHREAIAYLFYGACAMAVNTVCYWVLYDLLSLNNTLSTALAWLAAVVFAFVTNKLLVFRSHRDGLYELVTFFAFRAATGALDVLIMHAAVDILRMNGLIWKLISNVIVTVLNYIFSRLIIFKPRKK